MMIALFSGMVNMTCGLIWSLLGDKPNATMCYALAAAIFAGAAAFREPR